MLVELRISNLGVIADATIEPTAGMTVITGETGAGQDDDRQLTRPAAGRAG